MKITTRSIPPPVGLKPLNRMRSILAAGKRFAVAVAQQQKIKRSDAEREAALTICHNCEKWQGKTCGVCGCFGKFKTWLETEHCPLAKW